MLDSPYNRINHKLLMSCRNIEEGLETVGVDSLQEYQKENGLSITTAQLKAAYKLSN